MKFGFNIISLSLLLIGSLHADEFDTDIHLENDMQGRKLIRDVDRRRECFTSTPRSADYHLDPFLSNNDRGDWGKCMPHEVFGILCEHMEAHKINNGEWIYGDGPLHDPAAEQLIPHLNRMHEDYCIHLDVHYPPETQKHLNNFLKYEGPFAETVPPPTGPCASCNYTVTAFEGKYYLSGIKQLSVNFERGQTYYFDTMAVQGAHPFKIGYAVNDPYTNGVVEKATQLVFKVPLDAPANLVYYCFYHPTMGSDISISTESVPTMAPTETLDAFFVVTVDQGKFAFNDVRWPSLTFHRGAVYTFDTSAVPEATPFAIDYKEAQGVCKDVAPYDTTTTYAKKDQVVYNNVLYKSKKNKNKKKNPVTWSEQANARKNKWQVVSSCPTPFGIQSHGYLVSYAINAETPDMLLYHSPGKKSMGKDIIVVPKGSANGAISELLNMQHHPVGYNVTTNVTEQHITYDMACVQRYQSKRFNLQMSLYCALAFYDYGGDSGSLAASFFEQDYAVSDTCSKMMKSNFVHNGRPRTQSYPPGKFCDSDMEKDTCTVVVDTGRVGGTCKAYCEGLDLGLTCVAASIPVKHDNCQVYRDIDCDAVVGDAFSSWGMRSCTCAHRPGNDMPSQKSPLLDSALALMESVIAEPYDWNQEPPQICSQDFATGAVWVINLRGYGTCTDYCDDHGLVCTGAYRNWDRTCLSTETWTCDHGYSGLCGGSNDGCDGFLQEGDGDCDSHNDCADDLQCGYNNCGDFRESGGWPGDSTDGWDLTDDCCYSPTDFTAADALPNVRPEDKTESRRTMEEEVPHTIARHDAHHQKVAGTDDFYMPHMACSCAPSTARKVIATQTETEKETEKEKETETGESSKVPPKMRVATAALETTPGSPEMTLNSAVCARMMSTATTYFVDNVQPYHYCPGPAENTCSARLPTRRFEDRPRTCSAFCEQHTSLMCVGGAVAERNSCDREENYPLGCDYVFEDNTNVMCDCGFDQSAKEAEDTLNERQPSDACLNMGFGGNSLKEQYTYITNWCEDDIVHNTCTVGVSGSSEREPELRSCSAFCASFIGMECVASTGFTRITDAKLRCGITDYSGDQLATCDDTAPGTYSMGCTCGFVANTTRSDRLHTGPSLQNNAGYDCPAYEFEADDIHQDYPLNEEHRKYEKVTLTIVPDEDRDDGSVKVQDAKADDDYLLTTSYNANDVEVCEGKSYTISKSDDPVKCSFGSRLRAESNCYAKMEMSFASAQKACNTRGGHLLQINTQEEFSDIRDLFVNQELGIGLFLDNDFEYEWDGYPGVKVDIYQELVVGANLTSHRDPIHPIYDCIYLSTRAQSEGYYYRKFWQTYCINTRNWICEANDSGDPNQGGDLMADEGGFCLWYLEDPRLTLPDDESGGFRNTDLVHHLVVSPDARGAQYRHYPQYAKEELLPLRVGELYRAELPGHKVNRPNWDQVTLDYLGRTDSKEPFLGAEYNDYDFHCHYSPTNFGMTRIYMQQHMLERLYPGSFKKHCFCGYQHLGKVVARCDCTLDGNRNNNCKYEHYGRLYDATVKENGEYVRCNNCNGMR